MESPLLTLVLISLLALQQGFYMWQIQKLINKVMSKSFYDYQISSAPPEEAPRYVTPESHEVVEEFESATQHISSLV